MLGIETIVSVLTDWSEGRRHQVLHPNRPTRALCSGVTV